jgi:hypothetical protein
MERGPNAIENEGSMTRDEAKAALDDVNVRIGLAREILKPAEPMIARYLKERTSFDSIGPIVDPTLWKNPERQAVEKMLTPLYEAAQTFIRDIDLQMAIVKAAMEKVRGAETQGGQV